MDEAPSSSAPAPEPEKEETASARQKSGNLPMKVVTGEKDADATDSTAFDDLNFDKPFTAPAEAGRAPSSGTPFGGDTAETEKATTAIAEAPTEAAGVDTAEIVHLKSGRVRFDHEHPDWSLIAKAFEAFIPECKTVEALKQGFL